MGRLGTLPAEGGEGCEEKGRVEDGKHKACNGDHPGPQSQYIDI